MKPETADDGAPAPGPGNRTEAGSGAQPEPAAAEGRRTCVLVLGMHRSGTSALSGMLSMLGCALPRSGMEPSAANPRGFFESTVIRDLNEEILASAGSSWDDVQEVDPGWLESPAGAQFLARAADVLAAEFGDDWLIVLKDPRICRLLGFWLRALDRAGYAVRPILIQRNPLEVAHSLKAKKGYGNTFNEMLWLRHVLDAEAGTRGMKRMHAGFVQLIDGWELVAQRAETALGLRWPRSLAAAEPEVTAFLSPELRRQQAAPERLGESPLVTDWLRETYAILSRWTEAGEDPADHPALDALRAELNAGTRRFGPMLLNERSLTESFRRQAARAKTQLAEAQQGADELRARCRTLERDLKAAQEDLKTEMARRRAAEEDSARRLAEARAGRAEAAREADRQAAEAAELSARLASTERELQDRFSELAGLVTLLAEHEQQIAALTADRDARRRSGAEEQALRVAFETEVQQLRDSTSWKVTRPLRWLVTRLRRLRGGAGDG